ncbi:MAG: class I SAM-dependent methyltransferase [Promethearchaeota archaeon]
MKMSKIEKKFINSKRHAKKNLEDIEELFRTIDLSRISNVLEIGCGVGIVSEHLNNKYNMNVVGTDVDPKQIKIAKTFNKENENLKYIKVDATELPFENDTFDLNLSLWVLHHIRDWHKVLEELKRVLKPKSKIIIFDLAYSQKLVNFYNYVNSKRILKLFVKNYGVYSINDIIDFFIKNNFELVHKKSTKKGIMKNHIIIFQKN